VGSTLAATISSKRIRKDLFMVLKIATTDDGRAAGRIESV